MEQWINGGFFFLEPEALAYMDEGLGARARAARAARRRRPARRLPAQGFWDCMDTYKDAVLLNDLWSSGEAPWRIWEEAALR